MKWAHLPNAGGLYDQDPELLDGFRQIFSAISRAEDEERKKQEAERTRRAAQRPSSGGRRASSRRRR